MAASSPLVAATAVLRGKGLVPRRCKGTLGTGKVAAAASSLPPPLEAATAVLGAATAVLGGEGVSPQALRSPANNGGETGGGCGV